MEPKILPVSLMPEHPKFIRLPSLSRSLVHSILPKACIAMHQKPLIYSVSPNLKLQSGPPTFSQRLKKKPKIYKSIISKPDNARPNSPSYSYKKMFSTKPSTPLPTVKHSKSKQRRNTERNTGTLYYCEINSPVFSKIRDSPLPNKKFATTLFDFKAKFIDYKDESNQEASQQCQTEFRTTKNMVIMKNISEVRSSQESSNESIEYYNIKHSM